MKDVIDNQIVKQTKAMRKLSEKHTNDFSKKHKEFVAASLLAEKLYNTYVTYFEANESNLRNEVK